jgi:hypothetical protein
VFNPNLALMPTVTEPPLKSKGLSPQDQSGDSRRSEHPQTHIQSIHNHD